MATRSEPETSAPRLVTDRWFRSCVRRLLVELPNYAAGLGLKVSGRENVVMVFPRFGKRIRTRADLLALCWYAVHVGDQEVEPQFERMKHEEIRAFLEGLA